MLEKAFSFLKSKEEMLTRSWYYGNTNGMLSEGKKQYYLQIKLHLSAFPFYSKP